MNTQRKVTLREALEKTLASGETLVWTGYPRTGTYFLRDLMPKLFVLWFLLILLLIGLLLQVVVPTYSDWIALPNEHATYIDYLRYTHPPAVYSLTALFAFAFALPLVLFFYFNNNLSNTIYAISDHRALSIQKRIVSQPSNPFKVLERKAGDFHQFRSYKRSDNSGGVSFEANRDIRKTNGKLNGLYGVDNIDEVERILRKQFGDA